MKIASEDTLMRFGAIYIAHNPRDGETIFKVGKTERSVRERMTELTADTSNLGAYKPVAFFVVTDIDAAEAACHKKLGRYRVQENREFFDLALHRIVQIVQGETASFRARDFVPKVAGESEEAEPVQLSAAEKLRAARDQKQARDSAWDSALNGARTQLVEWHQRIKARVEQAATELANVDIAKWNIAERFDGENLRIPFCEVTIYAKYTSDPPHLEFTASCGKTSGMPDFSRAVGDPKVERNFATWREPDDGRIGQISILPRIENNFPDSRKRLPAPRLCVQAKHLRYDDYKKSFKRSGPHKDYDNLDEAFEVFLDLVVENLKEVQYDVRKHAGEYRGRRKIRDTSKFNNDALRN